MRLKDTVFKLMVIILFGLIVLPVLGQESTETPIPRDNSTVLEGIVEASDGGVSITNPDNTFLLTISLGVSGFLIGVVILTFGWVLVSSISSLQDSVPSKAIRSLLPDIPPESMRPYFQPIADNVQRELNDFKEEAKKTVTPIDDLVGNILQIPSDILLQKMDEAGYIVLRKDDATLVSPEIGSILGEGFDLSGLGDAPTYAKDIQG